MAGKKDQVIISVISNLTNIQASNILADITKAKSKHAPFGRGTIAQSSIFDVGKILSSGIKQITGKGGK